MRRVKKRRTKRRKSTDRVRETAEKILGAFERGEVPEALAHLFICQRGGDSPTRKWSYGNRFWAMLNGHSDARGFRQWEAVGRSVEKGERAFYILVPLLAHRELTEIDPETGEEIETKRKCIYGFKGVPVFGLSQTEGEPLIEGETEFMDALPLVEVARSWGIDVKLRHGRSARGLGSTNGEDRIALGVRNLSTWAHELVHCADSRLTGGLKPGQHVDQEVVAELGSAALLECIGHEVEADRGGAWEYIQSYAGKPKQAIRACFQLVDRTCKAVALILETAEAGAESAALAELPEAA